MPIFRVERTKDFTVMSNCHLKDNRLTLKAKGLLSQMLSLPEDWDYTLPGLARINRESKDAIRSAVNELEAAGYIQRRQTIRQNGKFGANEYVIFERPQSFCAKPSSAKPSSENAPTEKPLSDKPTQLNTNILNTKKQNTDLSNTHSFPSEGLPENKKASTPSISSSEWKESKRSEITLTQMNRCREDVKERIAYDILSKQHSGNDYLEAIVELMVEAICSSRKSLRVAGEELPAEAVKNRLLQVDSETIEFVLDCMKANTTKIKNIKQYLLTALYNAPLTISSHFASLVNHDLYGGRQ